MTIGEFVRQGLYYARTCRSLWLFGFFIALATGGSNGGGRGGGVSAGGAAAGGGGFLNLSGTALALIAAAIVVAAVAAFILRFVGEGALIEGVVRARQGGTMTTREGFRAGWAHWGVLVRIGLLYVAATIASGIVLVAPCVIAMWTLGTVGALLFGIPALVIAVPWLVTLYLVQAFAMRIAVLENRRALDAIAKARLFLHGRLVHGLRLIVASFVGTLGIVLAGLAVIAPVALALVALLPVLRVFSVVVLACLILLPALYVLGAILGTFRSSIWTIGYVTQVPS
jgi:hypothetical protein